MIRKLFGTDGVRGIAGQPPMDEATVFRLARAAASFFRDAMESADGTPRVIIGRDTRRSGLSLARAAAAGFVQSGWQAADAGIAPTPAVALAVKTGGAAAGIMVTASHNPAEYNGVKFFGPGGRKLTDEEEAAIESRLSEKESPQPDSPSGDGLTDTCGAATAHAAHLGELLPAGALAGWKLVVDCAHGATSVTAPRVLRRFGAEVIPLGVDPDGTNINVGCGSEHPETMANAVRDTGARLGLAFDGDGDRLVVADETGSVLAGDELLAVLAYHGHRCGWVKEPVLAATVMANLGLDELMESLGGRVVRTPVGDRYVGGAIRDHGLELGGEPSGHLMFPDIGPGGDGLAGAVRLLAILLKTGEPLSGLRTCLRLYPQKTASLRVREKIPLDQLARLREAILGTEDGLGSSGRVLVRYSGTEPLLRFLVEAREAAEVERHLLQLVKAAASDLSPVEG